MTWQTGALNYAGPNCPGPAWNCTTSTHVVQISQAGGQNEFVCEPETPPEPGGPVTAPPDVCVIVQTEGDVNRAECREYSTDVPTAAQKCVITQTGAERNYATVRQVIEQTTGPAQDARQAADVIQEATEKNDLHVYQTVKQSSTEVGTVGTEAMAQKQDAHQLALVDQDQAGPTNEAATGTAGNFSHVHQVQDQQLSGAAKLQLQNTAPAPATQTQVFDCGPGKPLEPNQCVFATLDSDGNHNQSDLHQTISERATTTEEAATQEQGREDGGIEGDVHLVNPSGEGQNISKAHQVVTQRAVAPEGTEFTRATQDQDTDPGCCGASAIGGENSLEDVKQSVTQSANSPIATQFSAALGETNVADDNGGTIFQQLDDGNNASGVACKIQQHLRNNTDSENVIVSAPSPCLLLILTTCGSAGDDDGDDVTPLQNGDEETCETFDLTDDDGGSGLFSFLTSSPTFGLDVDEPLFGEPVDYVVR